MFGNIQNDALQHTNKTVVPTEQVMNYEGKGILQDGRLFNDQTSSSICMICSCLQRV